MSSPFRASKQIPAPVARKRVGKNSENHTAYPACMPADDEEVHVIQPNEKDVSFNWTDPKPSIDQTSYYYVRGEQAPDMEGTTSGELVWASPMWIKVEGKK